MEYKPEYEECKTIEKEQNISINKVYKAVYEVKLESDGSIRSDSHRINSK